MIEMGDEKEVAELPTISEKVEGMQSSPGYYTSTGMNGRVGYGWS